MTTYAALLAGAAEQIRQGAAPLRTDVWTAAQAGAAISDFHAVLDAIAAHTRRLLWPAQLRHIGTRTHRDDPAPVEAAATAIATRIEALVGAERPHPSLLTAPTTPWLTAAQHLRAASDLVATHFHPDGRPRTPDAAATTAAALDAGLVDLANLTVTILSAEEPLALRALQTGVTTEVITRHLPGLGDLTHLARTMTATDVDPDARRRLLSLPQTWTPIRTDDPVHELADRMHRLRHVTFDLTDQPADTLATLRDLTVAGVAVHAHAAAFHGANPTQCPDPAPGAHGTGALVLRGRAWQHLHRDLAHFITLAPPHPAVRDDLLALSRVLPQVAPLDSPTNTARLADPRARDIGATLNGAIATMTQIAEHAATAFSHLERAGTLHLRARELPRDVLADDPALVEAHLNDAIVRAPAHVTTAIREALAIAADHPITRLPADSRPGMKPTAVESGFSALTIKRGIF